MKKKIITSYEKISDELKKAIIEVYPDGFEDKIKTHEDVIKGGTFKALLFDCGEVSYLIKFQNGDYTTYLEEIEDDFQDEDDFDE